MDNRDCPHTQSNYKELAAKHYAFDLAVDFAARSLRGHVDITFDVLSSFSEIRLDAAHLVVSAVSLGSHALPFALAASENAWAGSILCVSFPPGVPIPSSSFVLRVAYHTLPSSSGLQWLSKEQTAGGQHPYLFSQFQAIHARSAFPAQDTPARKATYAATLRVPPPLRARMSAAAVRSDAELGNFTFLQEIPIATYLVALAVGNLAEQRVGPRSSVVTEPEMMARAVREFDGHPERFLAAAEALTGIPYDWGAYDILVLPPSFPYGGMENPMLTFVTPTLLAGDGSLVDVVAHEAAHSWAGNLVTNTTWEHFWLNEGFCVFLERKIIGRLRGEEERQLAYVIGHNALVESVKRYGREEDKFTTLVQDLRGMDPDDAFSSVPYERGSQLLLYLEQVVGGPAVFEPFFAAYFAHFAKKLTLVSGDFYRFFNEYFAQLPGFDQARLKEVDWDAWFNQRGMPPVDMSARFGKTLSREALEFAELFARAPVAELAEKCKTVKVTAWSAQQQILFLSHLVELTEPPQAALATEKVKLLGDAYGLDKSMNAEIRFKYCILAVTAGYDAGYANALEMAKAFGRMKFARPLYRALFLQPQTKELAVSTFKGHREFYHNICAKMIARDLKIE